MIDPELTPKDLNLFYEITASIHSLHGPSLQLDQVFDRIKFAFDVEGVSIALHDRSSKEFYFIYTVELERGWEPSQLNKMRFADHLGIAGWVFRNEKALIVQDVSKESLFFKDMDLRGEFVTNSIICVPLRTRKGPMGVLYVLNKLNGQFTQKELRLLETVSASIAIALENAKFHGQLKRQVNHPEQENLCLSSSAQDKYNFQGIIGKSEPMQHVFYLLEKVITVPTTVLIEGETGTGKELVAKAIHYNGPRRDKPFIAENCAALSEPLLESELFGHVKGAFTGAVSDKKGIFEQAHQGTVFLDEIEEMSPGMQVKLLRVLQEGKLRPVGAQHFVDVNARLITSTNSNLNDCVQSGEFREDLFYRINVFKITLPLLRSRKSDIPLLADFFVKKIASKFQRPPPRLSPEALELLLEYDWPGNVRELENEIERAITLVGPENDITSELLSPDLNPAVTAHLSEKCNISKLKQVVEFVERRMIIKALKKTQGNRTRAARTLGITRQGLANKIRRYHLATTLKQLQSADR